MHLRWALAAAACTAFSAAALADQASLTSIKDNTLFEEPTGVFSNGAGVYMFTGETISNGSRRGLVAFDVASVIPAGSIIDSVTLRMYCSRATAGTRLTELHRVLQNWGEGASDAGEPGGGGGISEPGDATWIHTFFPDQFWNAPGGDYSPASSGETSLGGIGFYNWSTTDMRSDVQSWLDSPGGNFGWLLLGLEDMGRSAKRLNTHEHTDAQTRPTLIVNYTIPEPTSLLAFVAGAALLLARRR
jgi:hypothetical protein